MKSPFRLLTKMFPKPPSVPPSSIQEPRVFSDKDLQLLKRIGIDQNALKASLTYSTQINFERTNIYREVDRAVLHWMVGSATELYADYATTYNQMQGASVWITSESKEYTNNLMAFLESIGMEERIFDWGWTAAAYGDLFVGVEGEPGLGVISIDDNQHPANVSRVDYKGVLVGFYRTPFETGGLEVTAGDANLLAPWEWVHIRVLGAKKKRPVYSDPTFSEYRTIHLMGPETKQVTSKYGTSLLINSIPIYKRLRLAEDSILLARLTRGILKYVYKIKVDGVNVEAAAEMVDDYMAILKRARALNTDPNAPNYDSKSNPMASVEDLFVPVWGDVNDIMIEEIGGKTDIRWIADIEELRNQLASALRCPLSLLGGYVQEASGQLGSEAIEKLDIRFARSSRRVQRALIEGITRLCQIHLAYQNMDPDPSLFEVCMSETSTAEEEQLRDSLDTGVDVITKFMEMLESVAPNFDKVEILNYFNQKLLKLGDLDLKSYLKKEEEIAPPPPPEGATPGPGLPPETPPSPEVGEPGEAEMIVPPMESRTENGMINEALKRVRESKLRGKATRNLDFIAALPLPDNTESKLFLPGSAWSKIYEGVEVKVEAGEKSKDSKKSEGGKKTKSKKGKETQSDSQKEEPTVDDL
jgi:hypothetical protein